MAEMVPPSKKIKVAQTDSDTPRPRGIDASVGIIGKTLGSPLQETHVEKSQQEQSSSTSILQNMASSLASESPDTVTPLVFQSDTHDVEPVLNNDQPNPIGIQGNPQAVKANSADHLPMSPPNRKAARAARQKTLQEKVPGVLAASRRLQSALTILDSAPPPDPPQQSTLTPLGIGVLAMNGVRLRAALRVCANFAVNMNRKSENKDFLDGRMLPGTSAADNLVTGVNIQEKSPGNDGLVCGTKNTPDILMIDADDGIPNVKSMTDTDENAQKDANRADSYSEDDSADAGPLNSPPHVVSLSTELSNSTVVAQGTTVEHLKGKKQAARATMSATDFNKNTREPIEYGSGAIENSPAIADYSLQPASIFARDEQMAGDMVAGTDCRNAAARHSIAPVLGGEEASDPKAEKESTPPGKIWPIFLVPDPMKMPGTFTSAICRQRNFHASPILTMTLRGMSSSIESPTTQSSRILLHFEVGLDRVEALCTGEFRIDDGSYWEENIREKRLRKLAEAKACIQDPGKVVEQNSIKKGEGEGWWIFFGVRFQQTGKDKRKGKGGKWACFGAPMKACLPVTSDGEVAMFGGGCDDEGNDVPAYAAKVRRLETRFSTGGISCMDLWQNADEWGGGVWAKVKHAMANNSLLVSSLYAAEEIITAKMRRAGMTEANGPNASKYRNDTKESVTQ